MGDKKFCRCYKKYIEREKKKNNQTWNRKAGGGRVGSKGARSRRGTISIGVKVSGVVKQGLGNIRTKLTM